MAILTKKLTPNDCIGPVSDAMNEVRNIQALLNATAKEPTYKAEWEANRKRAHLHLSEAWSSLGAALNTLSTAKFRQSNQEILDSKINEVQSLRQELASAREAARQWQAGSDGWQGMVQQLSIERDTNAASCETWKQRALTAEAAPFSESPRETDKLRRIRVLLMSSIHPDRVPPDDRPAMTRVWQSFMPSFEALLSS
jgi:hypothetical protein